MSATIVKIVKIERHVATDKANPPANGARIVMMPLTTIKDAKNLASALPLNLSPAEALAITMTPPTFNKS